MCVCVSVCMLVPRRCDVKENVEITQYYRHGWSFHCKSMSKQYYLLCFNIIKKVRGRKERGEKWKRRGKKGLRKACVREGGRKGRHTHTCVHVMYSVDPKFSQETTGYKISHKNT